MDGWMDMDMDGWMNGCSLGLAGFRGMLKSIIKGWSGSSQFNTNSTQSTRSQQQVPVNTAWQVFMYICPSALPTLRLEDQHRGPTTRDGTNTTTGAFQQTESLTVQENKQVNH